MKNTAPEVREEKPSWALRLAILFAVISLLGGALLLGY